MFGTSLIVFRETLEAALFVGIIAASTRGVMNRARWLALGVAVGAIGSLLMASAMDAISAWADGLGQDVVTVCILSVALAMLAWHCIWVNAHAKDMVADAKRLGASAASGTGTLWAVALAVALSVLREGAETVLFVSGLASGQQQTGAALAASVAVGLAVGVLVGWLIYAGLGKVKPQHLFKVTNGLILLLAGSLASQLAKTLSQADWLPWLGEQAWDISHLLPNDSLPGMLLHGVVGYDASPSQLQLMFYVGTVGLIAVGARQVRRHANLPKPVNSQTAAI